MTRTLKRRIGTRTQGLKLKRGLQGMDFYFDTYEFGNCIHELQTRFTISDFATWT